MKVALAFEGLMLRLSLEIVYYDTFENNNVLTNLFARYVKGIMVLVRQ